MGRRKSEIDSVSRRYIEGVLLKYPLLKKRLEQEYEQIKRAYPEKGAVNGKELIKTMDTLMLINLERNVQAVEDTVKTLNDSEAKVFYKLYVEGKSKQATAIECYISIETLYRRNRKIIKEAGRNLGVFFEYKY